MLARHIFRKYCMEKMKLNEGVQSDHTRYLL